MVSTAEIEELAKKVGTSSDEIKNELGKIKEEMWDEGFRGCFV